MLDRVNSVAAIMQIGKLCFTCHNVFNFLLYLLRSLSLLWALVTGYLKNDKRH